jgi:DNA sulfur modification protein DndC
MTTALATTNYQDIKQSIRNLYLEDSRPWLVGFSGGKDSTMVASMIFDAVLSIPESERTKPISVLCTDTRVEIPAIVETIEATLDRMGKFSRQQGLNIDVNPVRFEELSHGVNLLKPPAVVVRNDPPNAIGESNRIPNAIERLHLDTENWKLKTDRWCTQRMKIDPVNVFVKRRLGHWGEAVLHLGARRAESATRAQTMAGMAKRNGLRRHPDLPRVWVSNPIEYLSTEEVWAYLLQTRNPWGGDNRALYRLYSNASGGERFVSTSCCSGRVCCPGETLVYYRDPANGKRDTRRMNGNEGNGPLLITARRELLKKLWSLAGRSWLAIDRTRRTATHPATLEGSSKS